MMSNNIGSKELTPARAFQISDVFEKMRQKLSSETYPSVAGHCELLLSAGLDAEAIDLQIRVTTSIRDYINKLSEMLDKAKASRGLR
ncbi:MAG: hypothetical protein Kapaf2KO_22690 [Candidatus Kapaibacteriales bacterium]